MCGAVTRLLKENRLRMRFSNAKYIKKRLIKGVFSLIVELLVGAELYFFVNQDFP